MWDESLWVSCNAATHHESLVLLEIGQKRSSVFRATVTMRQQFEDKWPFHFA
jgi:hypothetical protein